jgi:RNA polymerase sigma factor (TIGR02999 family)
MMTEVTRLLSALDQGEPHAASRLLPLVYDELRKLAAQRMAQEQPGQTLQPTALVHEAYLRLVGQADPGWQNRGHFFAAAAEAMRRILVEQARRKRRAKHGGELHRACLDIAFLSAPSPNQDLLALDEALTKLATADPFKAQLIQLRFFGGLSNEEVAEILGISAVTAKRHWRYARAWLDREVSGSSELPGTP